MATPGISSSRPALCEGARRIGIERELLQLAAVGARAGKEQKCRTLSPLVAPRMSLRRRRAKKTHPVRPACSADWPRIQRSAEAFSQPSANPTTPSRSSSSASKLRLYSMRSILRYGHLIRPTQLSNFRPWRVVPGARLSSGTIHFRASARWPREEDQSLASPNVRCALWKDSRHG